MAETKPEIEHQCDVDTFKITNFNVERPEAKQYKDDANKSYYDLAFTQSYEDGSIGECLVELPRMKSTNGITPKAINTRMTYRMTSTIPRAGNEEMQKARDIMNAQIYNKVKAAIKEHLPNIPFVKSKINAATVDDTTKFRYMIWESTDAMTGEARPGADSLFTVELFKYAKSKTLFTGPNGVNIDDWLAQQYAAKLPKDMPEQEKEAKIVDFRKKDSWKYLEGVTIDHVPLVLIKGVRLNNGEIKFLLYLKSTVVLGVEPRNSTSTQTKTIAKYANDTSLMNTLSSQLNKLTAAQPAPSDMVQAEDSNPPEGDATDPDPFGANSGTPQGATTPSTVDEILNAPTAAAPKRRVIKVGGN